MTKTITIYTLIFTVSWSSPLLASDDWLANEVLTQLSDIRRDMSGLKKQVQQLRTEIDALKTKAGDSQGNVGASFDIGEGKRFGKADAEYAIVEFTDYECPFCARHNQKTLGKIKKKYVDSGKLQYLVRDFPLGFHRKAKSAAIAANCAEDQDAYKKMHDQLFESQSKLSGKLFEQIAANLELDMVMFKECLTDPKQEARINDEIALGERIGISGTPAFLIGRLKNGQLTDIKALSGAQPFSSFTRIIDSVIN